MKKIILILLAFSLLLAGCGEQNEKSPESAEQIPESSSTETVPVSRFDFGDIHYSLQLPVYEITMARGIWGPTEYGNFKYNDKGQLIEKSTLPDSYAVYTFEYDDLGRLTKETETTKYGFNTSIYTYEDSLESDFFEITPFQNRRGLILTEQTKSSDSYANGNTFHHEYQFDSYGRVVQNAWSNRAIGSRIVQDYEYDAYGRIAKINQTSYTNGTADGGYDMRREYDGLGRLIREDFADRYSDFSSFFAYIYDVTRWEEISTATDDALLTKDLWVGFPEEDLLPMPSSCLHGISQPEQEQTETETVYTFFLCDDREEADRLIQKYLAILRDVCGFTWDVGPESVSICRETVLTASLTTFTNPGQGCYLQLRIPVQ